MANNLPHNRGDGKLFTTLIFAPKTGVRQGNGVVRGLLGAREFVGGCSG